MGMYRNHLAKYDKIMKQKITVIHNGATIKDFYPILINEGLMIPQKLIDKIKEGLDNTIV